MPEKLYSIKFLKLMPPTIFTKSIDEIEKFKKKYKIIVIKPTHGYGGKNIFFINKSTNKKKISKYLKKHDHVMAQKFIPQIKFGDKRIFIIGGVIKGAIRRIPMKDSIVSNIGQGGKAVKTSLTKNELSIAKIVASDLKKNKIIFAGIDLISNYLTGDINITSPTGLKNFKDLTGINLAIDFWNYLEKN
jgi:glutathione synthase